MVEGKFRNYVFTINSAGTNDEDLISPSLLSYTFERAKKENFISLYVFQLEKGEETGRLHYQGCLSTSYRIRKSTLLRKLFELISDVSREQYDIAISQITLNPCQGTFEENFSYCTKSETRVGSDYFCSPSLRVYSGEDLNFLEDKDERYPWQSFLFSQIFEDNEMDFKTPDSREIIWMYDSFGCSGKSLFSKYLCINHPGIIKLPFGSSQQLRSAVISAGPRNVYLLDIPRTLGDDDSMNSIYSVIEDLKNGFVTSAMYGKFTQLIFPHPHVIIFSNMLPIREKLTSDRWSVYSITNIEKDIIRGDEVLRWNI